jgi:hypothetical protein
VHVTEYKFVELSVVTDDSLTEAVNDWVAKGWQLDRLHFVVSDRSRRPTMAFIAFVRDSELAK